MPFFSVGVFKKLEQVSEKHNKGSFGVVYSSFG
jgi:hypothetical protein